MRLLVHILRTAHILSLDVVAGACCMSAALAWKMQVTLPWQGLVLLGNAVWIIYTADHLFDAFFHRGNVSSLRRAFHIQYRRALLVLLIAALAAESTLLIHLHAPVWKMAFPAAGITLIYLALNWVLQRRGQRFYIKEIMIAAGYCAGVLALPLAHDMLPDKMVRYAIPASFIFLAALANVLLIALYGEQADEREKQSSARQWIGRRGLKTIILVILGSMTALSGFFWFPVSLLMVVQLGWILLHPRYFALHERYRAWTDGVFLLPGLFLVYHIFS